MLALQPSLLGFPFRTQSGSVVVDQPIVPADQVSRQPPVNQIYSGPRGRQQQLIQTPLWYSDTPLGFARRSTIGMPAFDSQDVHVPQLSRVGLVQDGYQKVDGYAGRFDQLPAVHYSQSVVGFQPAAGTARRYAALPPPPAAGYQPWSGGYSYPPPAGSQNYLPATGPVMYDDDDDDDDDSQPYYGSAGSAGYYPGSGSRRYQDQLTRGSRIYDY